MKNVVITGTNSGFGRLTAETLARKGYNVFATMRNTDGKNMEAAEELRNWAKSHKHRLTVVEMDVTSDGSVNDAISKIMELAGKIDVVVNNSLDSLRPWQKELVKEKKLIKVILQKA